ncbi:hypothetical protein K461DRAFT_67120 [Myriangium duriaei CBS 260.36]|uniref:Uncharacterized protein n=1 Tax=Myriangium duriaei CBS 260.36 TaxID=1168546 RepID=A0A9P4MCL6_9PEZI|nr:hypothetical protein K461DRAFT_67120 [Myriangium duriaei CBS 260.36]
MPHTASRPSSPPMIQSQSSHASPSDTEPTSQPNGPPAFRAPSQVEPRLILMPASPTVPYPLFQQVTDPATQSTSGSPSLPLAPPFHPLPGSMHIAAANRMLTVSYIEIINSWSLYWMLMWHNAFVRDDTYNKAVCQVEIDHCHKLRSLAQGRYIMLLRLDTIE